MANSAPVGLDRYTTLALGGPAGRIVEAADAHEMVATVREADRLGEPVLILAGGSNVVIAEEGFAGTVVLVRAAGITVLGAGDEVIISVSAGHVFDELVAWSIAEGLIGLECLSGIPGSVGATPIQNVGAYGQEIADVTRAVRVFDRSLGTERVLAGAECGFVYRNSIFKRNDRFLVLGVEYALRRSAESSELRFGELTRRLGLAAGGTAPPQLVREAVLELRQAKGMVIDPNDSDTRSVGSFFTNPLISPADWDEVASRADAPPPRWELPDGSIKTSAAWLIEHAGFARGYGYDGVAISTKHTLALTNTGTGTTSVLLKLAREIRDGVQQKFGVRLVEEPVLVGVTL